VEPTTATADRVAPNGTGLDRVRRLWRLFRAERTDPEPFYRALAAEAVVDLDRRHGLAGTRVLDVGCGPGWYVEALRRAGATVAGLDGDRDALSGAARRPAGLVLGDAGRLPFPDASFDGVFCSNLLEHAADTDAVLGELVRVLRPGGWGYLSWTNWYSPWGGHDMTPYQYLGPGLGPRLYERRHGPPRKNRYGEGLFAVHVGPTVRRVRCLPGVVVERVEPRYWPRLRLICAIPVVREVATWNCVIRFRREAVR
jgi:SAM-dependent methyltransferase